MTEEKKEAKPTKGVSRREFIAGTVGGVVVGAVVGAATGSLGFPRTITKMETTTQTQTQTQTQTVVNQFWLPAKWDQTADIVIVGYGGAGAAAGITAHDLGASVIVLEKTPTVPTSSYPNGSKYPIRGGGGSTKMAFAGNWTIPANFDQEDVDHLYAGSWGSTPKSVIQAFLAEAVDTDAWETKMGIKHTLSQAPASATPGSSEDPGLGPSQWENMSTTDNGPQLFYGLDQAAASRGFPILFNTAATSLIQNPQTKEILGVTAVAYPTPTFTPGVAWQPPTSGGTTLNIKANKAVILATGSYEFNEPMLKAFMRSYPVHFYCWPYNTGDGIKMAQRVGAGIWHTNTYFGRPCFWVPDYTASWGFSTPAGQPYIWVDVNGRRYTNEGGPSHALDYPTTDFDLVGDDFTRIPTFLIFDQTAMKAGPMTTSGMGMPSLPPQLGGPTAPWSSDNSAELAKGWIQQGSDIPSLVAAINSHTYTGYTAGTGPRGVDTMPIKMDPNVLSATISTYNTACAAGVDAQFGRSKSTLVPIQTPPFYAMPLYPSGCNTEGGPIRNENCQVCDPDSNPIPRLYEAGEMGGIFGFLYEGGGECTQIIVSGRIAATNAVAETPWS